MRDLPDAVHAAEINVQARAEQLITAIGVGGNLLHDPLPLRRPAVDHDRLAGEVMQVELEVVRRRQVTTDERRDGLTPLMLAEGFCGLGAEAFPDRIFGDCLLYTSDAADE